MLGLMAAWEDRWTADRRADYIVVLAALPLRCHYINVSVEDDGVSVRTSPAIRPRL